MVSLNDYYLLLLVSRAGSADHNTEVEAPRGASAPSSQTPEARRLSSAWVFHGVTWSLFTLHVYFQCTLASIWWKKYSPLFSTTAEKYSVRCTSIAFTMLHQHHHIVKIPKVKGLIMHNGTFQCNIYYPTDW